MRGSGRISLIHACRDGDSMLRPHAGMHSAPIPTLDTTCVIFIEFAVRVTANRWE